MARTNSMVSLADWRRRMADLYARVRANPDPRAAWRDWRAVRDALFAEHPQSPLPPAERAGFQALPFFDYDPRLRFLVGLDGPGVCAAERLEIGDDGTVVLEPAARTRGLVGALGGELTVYWITGYGGGIFLPFRDATSGAESFGGGRYLLDGLKGADLGQADGRLVLDFNFAYNPSCAYSAAWTCPLAPAQNRLSEPVRAGEQAAAAEAAGTAQRLRA